MADPVWNGFLRLSLVSCPIRLAPATSDGKRLKLDMLSARTGNPVTQQFVDGKTGDVVPGEALVKGYEFEKSRYVTLTDAELQKLGGGAGNIIDLDQFVPRDQVDRIYIEAVYYLHPEGQLASDTIISLRAGNFDPKQLHDRFQDDLQKLVDEKAKNVPPAPPAANEARRTRSLRAPEPARVTEAPP